MRADLLSKSEMSSRGLLQGNALTPLNYTPKIVLQKSVIPAVMCTSCRVVRILFETAYNMIYKIPIRPEMEPSEHISTSAICIYELYLYHIHVV